MKVLDENATECFTVNDELDFTAILSGKNDPVKTFQELCKAIFSVDELILCSPTGKCIVKCVDSGARPPLDRGKVKHLFSVAEQHLKFDQTTAHKKLENFQKVLRRQ